MSCIQVTAFRPSLKVLNHYNTDSAPAIKCIAPANVFEIQKFSLKPTFSSSKQCIRFMKSYLRPTISPSTHHPCTPMCLFGGKGKSESGNEASPWKSLEKSMGSLKKEQSLEDVLRQQIEKQEYYDEEGGGGNPPTGGGGGGSGDRRSSGGGGTGDDDLHEILDEILQVTLATAAFIFLYFYIIDGDQIRVYTKDFIRYLFTKRKSVRLRVLMSELSRAQRRWKARRSQKPVDVYLVVSMLRAPTMFNEQERIEKAAVARRERAKARARRQKEIYSREYGDYAYIDTYDDDDDFDY